MARVVKPKPRRVQSVETMQTDKRPASVIVEHSAARQILNLPIKQRAIIIASIQEGTRPSDIAKYATEEGWLKVSENTFKQYIMAFKRVYPELCEGADHTTIDSYIDGKRPNLDEEQELERLFRFQKTRLKVGHDFERSTNFLHSEMHREVKVAGVLLETLANIRGKTKGVGRPSGNQTSISNAAQEELRKVDSNEAAQERLASSLTGLIGLVNAKSRTESQA